MIAFTTFSQQKKISRSYDFTKPRNCDFDRPPEVSFPASRVGRSYRRLLVETKVLVAKGSFCLKKEKNPGVKHRFAFLPS